MHLLCVAQQAHRYMYNNEHPLEPLREYRPKGRFRSSLLFSSALNDPASCEADFGLGRPLYGNAVSRSRARGISRRAFLKYALRYTTGGAVALAVLIAASPAEALLGGRSMVLGHKAITSVSYSVTISSSTNNVDFRTLIINAGWNGTSVVTATVTINSGVYIGSSSTSSPAFTISGSFPGGSVLNLINNGHISGAGAAGGTNTAYNTFTAAGTGGTALSVSVAVNITNNGYIWGGGGGGGAGHSYSYTSTYGGSLYFGGSGGGGGGTTAGTRATATAGGAGAQGKPAPSAGGTGGAGGNPGAGAQGGKGTGLGAGGGGGGGSPGYSGGKGGSNASAKAGQAGGTPGYYVTGNSNVTWLAAGTRLGQAG